jgi:HPt (histidine-containing phosphotransfer) domain-containing protein
MTLADEIRGLLKIEAATAQQNKASISRHRGDLHEGAARSREEAPGGLPRAEDRAGRSFLSTASLRRHAHSLAGAAGTFGYHRLGEQARVLEGRLLAPGLTLPLSAERIEVIERDIEEIARIAALGPSTPPTAHTPRSLQPAARPGEASDLIYLLEDDPLLSKEIARQLSYFGWTAECFETSRDLIAAYSAKRPEALVVDVVLPEGELEGPRIAAELLAGAGSGVPVIYISGKRRLAGAPRRHPRRGRAYLPSRSIFPWPISSSSPGVRRTHRSEF